MLDDEWPNSSWMTLGPCTWKNLENPGPAYEKSAETTERFCSNGRSQAASTAKVALSRVTFNVFRDGKESSVMGVKEEGVVREWRSFEQKLSSRNSRFMASVPNTGDIWIWKEKSS